MVDLGDACIVVRVGVWVLILVISVVMAERHCTRLLCRFFSNAMIRMLMRILENKILYFLLTNDDTLITV